jgi:pimeloyl-ACP methyl ester carboxylesterase
MKLLAVLAFSLAASGAFAQTPAAVTTDPPRDAAHPAGMAYVQIPSHGSLINGVLYTASGAGPHPTLLLLHGFPGNEQNLDLAQAVRRAGFNVLTLHYRGSWGSPGAFSFAHAAEDADAALAFLRDAKTAARFGIDAGRLFVAGHSMGGFMAASAGAHDAGVKGVIMISAWNIAEDARGGAEAARKRAHAPDSEMAEDVIPLGGATVDGLIDEIAARPERFDFLRLAPALATRPVLLVTADDGSWGTSHKLADALKAAGDRDVGEIHMATDHPFSDHRIALETAVVDWLAARR